MQSRYHHSEDMEELHFLALVSPVLPVPFAARPPPAVSTTRLLVWQFAAPLS